MNGPRQLPFLSPRHRSNLLLGTSYLLLSTVGAIAIAALHTTHALRWGAVYAVLLSTLLALFALPDRLRPSRLVMLCASLPLWAIVLVSIAVVDQVHLRHALSTMDPLTSALALEAPARALLHGHEPYSVHLPGAAPISPGPGWIALLLPLTAWGGTGLLGMLSLGLAACALWHKEPSAAGLFCLLLLTGPLFLSQAANGQDLYCISLFFVMLAVLLERFAKRPGVIVLLSMLAGCIGTARLPMLLFVWVLGLGLWRKNRRSGMLFLFLATLATLAFDLSFAYWAQRNGDWFQPVHVFQRGTAQAGSGPQIAVALLGAAAVVWVFGRMSDTAESWMLGAFLLMSALFIPESVKEFVQTGYDLRWEGSTYFTFPLPLLAAVLALRLTARGSGAPARSC